MTPTRGHRATATVRGGPVSSMRRSALAVELAPHGITASTLALGTVRTPIDGAFPFDRDAFETAYRGRIPLGCYSVPDENVGALPLLASDAGAYINGPGSSWTACSPNRCTGCASSASPRTRRTTLSSATLW
ncbi:SDR family oxidoreductase [Streptomyces sp. NPDC056154]|uniref:SDR family oxidoreductase n=2 Tax=Streptomyces TaxID=1883 RepID=UPI0035DEC0C4